MADPFLSEIRMMSFNFAPKGWALCNGQLLPINQNQALFSLLGTTYGGDGRVTFGLPDLRGRVPTHMGNGQTLGQRAGEEGHTLTLNEMAQHNHLANATNSNGSTPIDSGAYLGAFNNGYSTSMTNITTLNPATVGNVGGSQAHQNMQPFLTINFSIALQGIFPSQN
ncbi:microcystin-dependent protein [Bradyrhizobium sp. i1.8.4]|uniref:phage tail protein n=1 Tax=unclassified Bradyrhizobium TaxID=2631580 RepID=UPI003D225267